MLFEIIVKKCFEMNFKPVYFLAIMICKTAIFAVLYVENSQNCLCQIKANLIFNVGQCISNFIIFLNFYSHQNFEAC